MNTTLRKINAGIGRRLQRDFPQLGELKFTHRWEGWFDVSPARTPGIHELAPRLFSAVGFSGRGIPTATSLGHEIAKMIASEDASAMAFPLTPLPRNRLGALKGACWHNVVLPIRHFLL